MRPAMTQKQERHRRATSKAMKHLASLRQCKSCSRKNATTKFVFDECVVYRCRYCKHETSYTRITFSDC